MNRAAAALTLGLSLTLAACAHRGGEPHAVTRSAAPAADSITLALWHFDEAGGTHCADAGAERLAGVAGLDTRTDFGRFGGARVFTYSIESWVYVPYEVAMDSRRITIEAWIEPAQLGIYEDTPIAGRWTQYANEQSWLFSLTGLQRDARLAQIEAPGFHDNLVVGARPARLMFAFQPAEPLPPQVFFSASEIPLQRWTHVAVSHDGGAVRFYINGRLDAQYATRTSLRPTTAPILIGNYFDTHVISDFSGDFRVGTRVTHPPVYAFQGTIDELRISNEAREEFGIGP